MAKSKKQTTPLPQTKPKPSITKIIALNIVCLIVGGLAFMQYSKMAEIKWIYTMLADNYAVIKKNPKADYAQRLTFKLGYNYHYLNFIKQNTPPDAKILIPERSVFLEAPTDFRDSPELGIRGFYSLIYPRQPFYEKDSVPDITHVAIVNGWGFDRLNYPVAQQRINTVLPINQPK
jgi:hypothetical protein